MAKRCSEKGHTNCYNKCRKCGHCDTSYEENPNLVCNCKFCDCDPSVLVKLTLAAMNRGK